MSETPIPTTSTETPQEGAAEETTNLPAGNAGPTEGQPVEEVATETPATEESSDPRNSELPEWARESLSKANREAANYRTQLREVQDKLAAAKSPEDFAAVQQRNQELIRENVAILAGLPPELATRLKGETLEELQADAKLLSKFSPQTTSEPEALSGGLNPSGDDGIESAGPVAMVERYGKRRR